MARHFPRTFVLSVRMCVVAAGVCVALASAAAEASPVLADLTVWLDASDSSSLTITDGKVSAWQDTRGINPVFSQANAAQRPVVSPGAAQTGLQTVQFDPTLQSWLRTNQSLQNHLDVDGYTIFAVFRASTVSSNSSSPFANEAILSDSSGFVGLHLRQPGGGPVLDAYHWDTAAKTASHNIELEEFYVVAMWFDGSMLHHQIFLQPDAAVAAGNLGSGALTRFLQLGKRSGDTLSNFFDGDLGEMLIYDATLDSAERFAVMQYLSKKWMPEPGSATLMLAAAAMLLGRRRPASPRA